jgi:hypothetical protein
MSLYIGLQVLTVWTTRKHGSKSTANKRYIPVKIQMTSGCSEMGKETGLASLPFSKETAL